MPTRKFATGNGAEPYRGQGDGPERDYREQGYALWLRAVPPDRIDKLLERYLELVRAVTGRGFTDPNGADLIGFYNQHRDIESRVYNDIRRTPWLEEFCRQEAIVGPVRRVLGDRLGLFRKVPFRIDLPLWPEELAHWHQDFFYVKGNTDVVTAWIPLQDTTFLNGCPSVMPRSHRLDAVEHDLAVGKRRVPGHIFRNEIRMVEMKKGDLLLFHSLLLHSGNLNLSQTIRYSVQPRYSPLEAPADDGMGGFIPLAVPEAPS
jgi:phytanoyl-CoA hydroxylase